MCVGLGLEVELFVGLVLPAVVLGAPPPPPPPVTLLYQPGDPLVPRDRVAAPAARSEDEEIRRLLRFWQEVVNSRPPRELAEIPAAQAAA